MSHSFPAILVGGPPHGGKSVLTYLLSQRLRAAAATRCSSRSTPCAPSTWEHMATPAP